MRDEDTTKAPTGASQPDAVIFATAHGATWPLEWFCNEGTREHIEGLGELDALNEATEGREFGDGVFVAFLKFVDDGPGDWPGTREWSLQATKVRPISEKEWRAFRADEHVFDREAQP